MGFARNVWRPGSEARRFIPTSVALAVVYLGVHRVLNLLCALLLGTGPFVAFWRTPVVGPVSLLGLCQAVNALFIVYLAIDLASTCRRRGRRKLPHCCAYVAALITVGAFQFALHQAGAAADVLEEDILAYHRQHPSLAIRYGPLPERARGELDDLWRGAVGVRVRHGAGDEVSFALCRFEPNGDRWTAVPFSRVDSEQLPKALRGLVRQRGANNARAVVSVTAGTWQDLVSTCESAFEAGFRRVVLAAAFHRRFRTDVGEAGFPAATGLAEVVASRLPVTSRGDLGTLAKNSTILVRAMTKDEYEYEQFRSGGGPIIVWEGPFEAAPSGPDRAFACRVGMASVDPDDVEGLSDHLAWERRSIRGDGGGATIVMIQAARQIRCGDLMPTIAATVLEKEDLPGPEPGP